MPYSEPRNPFYLLLLAASILFVVTALAYAVVPVLDQKAAEHGQAVPQTGLRVLLRDQGALWLLYEVGAMIVFGLLSMGLDRLRRLQKERAEATISPSKDSTAPPET